MFAYLRVVLQLEPMKRVDVDSFAGFRVMITKFFRKQILRYRNIKVPFRGEKYFAINLKSINKI